jgi:hypothetical protein
MGERYTGLDVHRRSEVGMRQGVDGQGTRNRSGKTLARHCLATSERGSSSQKRLVIVDRSGDQT